MTIGSTSVKLSTIIEHSLRRAGVPAEAQTPEIVDTAKNNLFFILMNYANKGMTYWSIDQQFMTLITGKVRNDMPSGTVDILNANYRTMTVTTGTDTSSSTNNFIRTFTETTTTVMIKLKAVYVGDITISYSADGVTYTDNSTITHDGSTNWYTVDPSISAKYIKLTTATGVLTTPTLTTVSAYSDTDIYRMNRDDYSSQTNKQSQGTPLQYWFDRQKTPAMLLWPSPSEAATVGCITYYRNHQISDVGNLNQELDIPVRWLEATVWALSKNMAIEIPGTPPDRIALCITMAEQSLSEAQVEERDNSPVSLVPGIGVYTE